MWKVAIAAVVGVSVGLHFGGRADRASLGVCEVERSGLVLKANTCNTQKTEVYDNWVACTAQHTLLQQQGDRAIDTATMRAEAAEQALQQFVAAYDNRGLTCNEALITMEVACPELAGY